MPRAKDTDLTAAVAHPEAGFAVLEAKVEEIQEEVAADSSQAAEPQRPSWSQEAPGYDPTGAATTLLSAFREGALAAIRFQTETFASFARVRTPQDFLAAQIACGERALGIYAGALAQATQAPRAFVPSFGVR